MECLGRPSGHLEAPWEPLGPIGDTIGGQIEANRVQKDAKGRPREAKGRPKESSAGRFGDPWGASLAKEDFGSKTSKLAEAFDENCRGGPQNSNASTIFSENVKKLKVF